MKGTRAAIRYAKAFMQLAQEKGVLDAVLEDVKLIQNTISENKELALLLKNPLVKTDKKEAILQAIFTGKVKELTRNFIGQIVSHQREALLGIIANEFVNEYNKKNNISQVDVTTTMPLSEELKETLIQKIKAQYNLAHVELIEHIDKDLIGGIIIKIGDKQLDASIRRKLNDIKQELVHA